MSRLLILVEGQTEEEFVNEVLRPHLVAKGFYAVIASLGGDIRARHAGGIMSWPKFRNDIVRHLKQDRGCFVTIMVDYYGLPVGLGREWPGRADARGNSLEKGAYVASALLADVASVLGNDFDPNRFVPYVLMHEFEALLFSDCTAFCHGICRPELSDSFQTIRDGFATPEDINDSPVTAPSKRILQLVTGYQKPLLGVLGILEIGLDTLRSQCPSFHRWLTRLENLAPLSGSSNTPNN